MNEMKKELKMIKDEIRDLNIMIDQYNNLMGIVGVKENIVEKVLEMRFKIKDLEKRMINL